MSLLVAVGGGITKSYAFVSTSGGRFFVRDLNGIYPNLGYIVFGGLFCLLVVAALLERNKRKRDGSKRESGGGTQVWKESERQKNIEEIKFARWAIGILLGFGVCSIIFIFVYIG